MNFNILIFILSLNFSGASSNETKVTNNNTQTLLLDNPKKKPPRPYKVVTTKK